MQTDHTKTKLGSITENVVHAQRSHEEGHIDVRRPKPPRNVFISYSSRMKDIVTVELTEAGKQVFNMWVYSSSMVHGEGKPDGRQVRALHLRHEIECGLHSFTLEQLLQIFGPWMRESGPSMFADDRITIDTEAA